MASNIGEIRSGVATRIKDGAGKLTTVAGNGALDTTKDVDAAIVAAREEYEKTRPRERAALVTGLGASSFDYALDGGSPAIAGWSDGLSLVSQVVYPWSSTTPEPPVLDEDEYAVVRLASGLVLRFFTVRPLATEQFLVEYTTQHTVDNSVCTIRPADDEAFKDLAAAHACEMLASFYGHSTDSSIGADTVNHLSKAQEYRAMAREFRDSYARKTKGVPVAAAFASIPGASNTGFSDPTRTDYHFHGRR